eukprot:4547171-Amphidinium_carterae.2
MSAIEQIHVHYEWVCLMCLLKIGLSRSDPQLVALACVKLGASMEEHSLEYFQRESSLTFSREGIKAASAGSLGYTCTQNSNNVQS